MDLLVNAKADVSAVNKVISTHTHTLFVRSFTHTHTYTYLSLCVDVSTLAHKK